MKKTPSILSHVESFIAKHGLFRRGERVVVGVSGGADSVCLLLILNELARALRIQLSVAHLHHGIRGKAADRDAAFVCALCKRLRILMQLGRADVPGLAKARGISLEMAAREARHDFFRRAARAAGARVVATAHTADDQAETVLLRLARGAGMAGLAGIAPVSSVAGLTFVHPLLAVHRAAITAFLRGRHAAWREDATNRDVAILRNRVRHEILPRLEKELNPGIRQALLRTADIFREESDWLDRLARGILRRCGAGQGIRVAALGKQPVAARRRVWRLWLAGGGVPVESIDFDTVNRMDRLALDARGRGHTEIQGGWRAVKSAGMLRLEAGAVRRADATTSANRKTVIAVPGITPVPEAGWKIATRLAPGLHKDTGRRPGQLPARASLAAGPLKGRPLVVRFWTPGDRMTPLGLGGSRKLQDIFTDAKVPAARRHRVPVVECDGEIVWLPGYRVSAGWEVRDPAKPALQIAIRRTRS